MKNLFVFISIILLNNTFSFSQSIINTDMTFNIEITNKYMGRVKNRTIITQDSLIQEVNIAVNSTKYKKTERLLSVDEKNKIIDFLFDFPIADFKDYYYNKGVKDGIQIIFLININKEEKEIYISNYYIKELGELVKIINNLFTEINIYYSKDYIKKEIEK